MRAVFRSISLSYKNTPLKFREWVALDEGQSMHLLHKINDILNLEDLFILSTCNRTEVYYSSSKDQSADIIKLIAAEKNIDYSKKLFPYFKVVNDTKTSINHLFNVAIGLESQVVGDLQIINQVKKAYQQSADANVAGPLLHRLMHSIFYTNKRVVQETEFKDGAASVSYATVDLVEEMTLNIIDPRILAIGTGEIGSDVVRNLKEFGFKNVTVVNRTKKNADEMALECGYKSDDINNIKYLVQHSEVIISSIQAEKPIIELDVLKEMKIAGYKHFFDLSIPRSIDQRIEKIAGVSLHNIDHIKAKTNQALEKRLQSIEKVRGIIDESMREFFEWSKESTISPAIKKFKNALEEIRQEELAKYLKKLNSDEAKIVDDITRSIMQKIVKLPALNLKAACKRDDGENLAEVLNQLFNLEQQPVKKDK